MANKRKPKGQRRTHFIGLWLSGRERKALDDDRRTGESLSHCIRRNLFDYPEDTDKDSTDG